MNVTQNFKLTAVFYSNKFKLSFFLESFLQLYKTLGSEPEKLRVPSFFTA